MIERKVRCVKPCGGTVARFLHDEMIQFVEGKAIDGTPRETGDGRPYDQALTIDQAEQLAPRMRAVCMKCGRPHQLAAVLMTWRRMKRDGRASNNVPQRS